MAKCIQCSVKMGGMFGGIEAGEEFYNEAKNLGFNLPKDICVQCAKKLINNAKNSPEFKTQILEREKIEKIFATPSQLPPEMEDMGVVTGYSILGTGPLSEFLSSLTDLTGQESKIYNEKIKLAESNALFKIKEEAYNKDCNAIYNLHINLTEATSGKGMIMLSIYGSATKK